MTAVSRQQSIDLVLPSNLFYLRLLIVPKNAVDLYIKRLSIFQQWQLRHWRVDSAGSIFDMGPKKR
jgi:hypothetical protein